MNIIFSLILFYYLNNLQFKYDLIQKIARNAINLLYIAKKIKNVPNFNLGYYMLYVVGRKCFEVRRKKIITLPCAENNTQQTIYFAV